MTGIWRLVEEEGAIDNVYHAWRVLLGVQRTATTATKQIVHGPWRSGGLGWWW